MDRLTGGTKDVWEDFYRERRPRPRQNRFPTAPERSILDACLRGARPGPTDKVVELGCGGGRFVVEIARRTGAAPFGVDFSSRGVQQARAALRAAGLPDDGIVEDSIEAFASQHKDGFDIAVSFGLIEHFDDLRSIIAAHVVVVRPTGRIFVSSPNLSGPNLAWLRTAAPAIAAWHRPIRPDIVADALRAEGATDVRFAYVGGPRLFAPAEKRGGVGLLAFVAFYVTQKVFNGLSEAMMRLAPGLGSRLGGRRLASQFVVIATVPPIGSLAPAKST